MCSVGFLVHISKVESTVRVQLSACEDATMLGLFGPRDMGLPHPCFCKMFSELLEEMLYLGGWLPLFVL